MEKPHQTLVVKSHFILIVFTINATSPILILNDVLDIDFFATAWTVLDAVGATKTIWAAA